MRTILPLLVLASCGAAQRVQLTSPSGDLATRATVTVQFLVEGSSSLDVFLDDMRFARLEAPFTLVLDTASLTEGAHRVEGRTQNATSEVRTITVDRTPPRVVRRAPLGVQAPALRVPLEVDFDEPLDPGSVRADTARLLGTAGVIDATLTLSSDGRRITLVSRGARPVAALPITISVDGVSDPAGNVASADAWAIEVLPFQRVALTDERSPQRFVVDGRGQPWVVSTTRATTQVVEVWREGRWQDGRQGVPPTADITDLRVSPEGTLELAALDGTQLLLMTRAADATEWQVSYRGQSGVTEARLTSRSGRPAVIRTPQGVRLARLENGAMTLSSPAALVGQFQVVETESDVVVATFNGSTLALHRSDSLTWESAEVSVPGLARPRVLRGRDHQNFRVIAVDTMTSRLVAFDLRVSFGSPGNSVRLEAWSTTTPPGELVEVADFPSLNREFSDTGDLGGRGFVVTRNNAVVSVWPYGWETTRQLFFSEQTPVTRVSAGEFFAIISDSRWFTGGTSNGFQSDVYRHGVIVQRLLGRRLSSELYLPND